MGYRVWLMTPDLGKEGSVTTFATLSAAALCAERMHEERKVPYGIERESGGATIEIVGRPD